MTETKQEIKIATNTERISNNIKDICELKADVKGIWTQVTNHLPHQIGDLEKSFIERMAEFKLSINKWLLSIMVTILMLLATIIFDILTR